jgi:Domain of unknown function (DUF4186)
MGRARRCWTSGCFARAIGTDRRDSSQSSTSARSAGIPPYEKFARLGSVDSFILGRRLSKYLAVAEPPRDGRQTPLEGNAIYYAQHATATCCRTCLEYWHHIPKGRPLTPEELDYFATLIDLFLVCSQCTQTGQTASRRARRYPGRLIAEPPPRNPG